MKMAWLGISLSLWKAFIVKREIRIFYKRNVQRNKMEVIMLLTSQMDFVVVVQPLSCVRLCNPMDCSTPDFPVLHHLPELAQTHVHWVSDAINLCSPFSSCLQSFPASWSFLMSQLFSSSGQNIGTSASASVLPNIQDWFPLILTALISFQSEGLSTCP